MNKEINSMLYAGRLTCRANERTVSTVRCHAQHEATRVRWREREENPAPGGLDGDH